MQITAEFIPDANIYHPASISLYWKSMFFFLNYLFNCRETRVPWCPHLPGLGSLPESLRVLLFGFLRALCNAVILTPSASVCKKALVPWITGSFASQLKCPQASKWPIRWPSFLLISSSSCSHQASWCWHPSGLLWAPWASLSWGELTGLTDVLWQFAGINYRPLYWPMGTDGQKWKFNTFHQFLLHPSCHHHKT